MNIAKALVLLETTRVLKCALCSSELFANEEPPADVRKHSAPELWAHRLVHSWQDSRLSHMCLFGTHALAKAKVTSAKGENAQRNNVKMNTVKN